MKSALSTTVLVLLVATFATEVLAAECFKPPFSRCNEKSFSNKDKKSKINIKLTDKELESLPTDIRKAIAAPGGIDPTRNVALAKAIAEYASRVSPANSSILFMTPSTGAAWIAMPDSLVWSLRIPVWLCN
ncbi:hypothetical protein CFE70_009822 [Pyrenophora teres f. teres 0-1]